MVGLKERKIYVNSLLKVLEFPGISFVGNSYSCIETGMFEGYGYCRSLPTLTLKVVLFSESARSVLTSLGLAAACNADRILIHDAA
jgi:hypothetical protein